jgi:hypothetical protein
MLASLSAGSDQIPTTTGENFLSRCPKAVSNAAAEFQCETGLSDACFPGHQQEMCPALPRGVPCLVELVPFEVAADERRFGDGCQVLVLRFVAVECASPELLVHGPDRLARCRREVALKHLRAPVVGAQRRGSIAKREMCFHLNSNGCFIGRLKVADALGMPDRGFVVVAPRSLFCQPHEGPIRLGSKLRPLAGVDRVTERPAAPTPLVSLAIWLLYMRAALIRNSTEIRVADGPKSRRIRIGVEMFRNYAFPARESDVRR